MNEPPLRTPWRTRWNLDERTRRFPILAAMRERVLCFDGAMGTMIHRAHLTLDDYAGKENCVEILNETRPDVIASIHRAYLDVGADIVETNTFGSMPVVLAEFGIAERAYDLSRRAAEIARDVARSYDGPRWVAGSVGPTTKMVTLGHIGFDEQRASYATQIHGLIDGGADVIQIETQFDILNLKCAVLAAREAMGRAGREVPIIAQVTIETTGTMLVGTEIAAALPVLEALDVDVVGLNCATGPDLMQEHARHLGRIASRFVSVLPNAGLPRNVGGQAKFDLTPEELARHQEKFVREYGVTAVGGCCGTTPEHIAVLAERMRGITPAPRPVAQPAHATSLYVATPLHQDPPPLIVGERTNANGSKRFKVPWPETVPIERADIVARWAADTLATRGACVVFTQVSRALRVSLAAADMGISLVGATFVVGGEPPTVAKVGQIVASGARCIPVYSFAEAGGRVGMGCAQPTGPNDLHLSTDAFAVLSYQRRISLIDDTVPAFCFTTLLPTSPRLMLNVENDDYGVIETRSCGCPLADIGLTQQVSDLRSFSRLTGEGVTLVGSDMMAVLEGVLPSRFGGSALDYQLLEEEDEQGFTKLNLLISPHLRIDDDQQVIDAVWEAMRASSVGADQARDMWQRAGTLRVRRTAPVWTARGKFMPLHLSRRSEPPATGTK